jgi:Flp pilus assembly protein TadG
MTSAAAILLPYQSSRPSGLHRAAVRLVRRFRLDRRGVATVEMAVASSLFLIPMLGGGVGFAQAISLQLQLDRALQGALLTAYKNASAQTTSTVSSNMTTALRNAYGSTAPTVTASLRYYCMAATATRSGSGSATSPTCTSPNIVATYVTVSASVTFTPMINVGINSWNQTGGTGGTVTISNTATVRIL